MLRKSLAIAASAMLLAAACGGGDSDEGAEPSASAPGASAAASEAPQTSAKASKAPAAQASQAPRASAQTGGGSAAPVKAASPGKVNNPKPGRYSYSATGEATDPLSGQKEKTPPDTRVFTDVSAAGNVFTAKTTSNQEQGSQTAKSRREANRVLLLSIHISQGGGIVEVQCDYKPPLEILHIPIKKEVFPAQQRKDGSDCTQTTKIEVVGQEDVKAMGRTWKTWKITQTTNYSFNNGSLTGTLNETLWLSPDLGNAIKSIEKNNGTFKTATASQKFVGTLNLTLIGHP